MTTIAAISLLAAVALYVTGNHFRNRCANLEIMLATERDKTCELSYALDDATREADRYRTSNAHLIAENNTLLIDLCHTEREAQLCRSHRQRRRDNAAGWILVTGLAREERKMVAWNVERVP